MNIKIGTTKSVCPVCLKVIDADKCTGNDGNIYMEKSCPDHGKFRTLIWEGNLSSYLKWSVDNTAVDPPLNAKVPDKGCPNDCGLCEEHLRKGCCMLLELTNRCNLSCPVCFASANKSAPKDLSIDEISSQYDFLMSHGGPFNIQLSGGEPTVRDDLPEIIKLGREKGFTFFQLNTNGIRLGSDNGEYAKLLKDSGLDTVFLQFDGLSDDVYITLRGKALFDIKEKAIENSVKANLGVVLVPVIAPGVNDNQVGDIINYALSKAPGVRGVHFQPISYFGRCSEERPSKPITIPKMLNLIEAQCGGKLLSSDFAAGGAENPYCSFHAAYQNKKDSFTLMPKKSGGCCCCSTTSDDSREQVSRQWSSGIADPQDGFDEFLNEIHNQTFTVSGMIFQDGYNLDLERLKRCYICEVDSSFGMVPFCAYNLTSTNGEYLYRGK